MEISKWKYIKYTFVYNWPGAFSIQWEQVLNWWHKNITIVCAADPLIAPIWYATS